MNNFQDSVLHILNKTSVVVYFYLVYFYIYIILRSNNPGVPKIAWKIVESRSVLNNVIFSRSVFFNECVAG